MKEKIFTAEAGEFLVLVAVAPSFSLDT